jgi:hypothetical protein
LPETKPLRVSLQFDAQQSDVGLEYSERLTKSYDLEHFMNAVAKLNLLIGFEMTPSRKRLLRARHYGLMWWENTMESP